MYQHIMYVFNDNVKNLIMAYSFRFLWDSFKYPLPWLKSIINEE